MLTRSNGRHKLVITVAALLLGFLANPSFGDESSYFPDDTHGVLTLNVPTLLKSKTLQQMEKDSPFLKSFDGQFGISADNIMRISVGYEVFPVFPPNQSMYIVTTGNPAKVDNIKANLQFEGIPWKEVKVGSFTVHQQYFNGDPKQPQERISFCVVEEKVVLVGPLASIRAVLERKKAVELSTSLRKGMKEAGPENAVSLVFDVQQMPRPEKKVGLAIPGLDSIEAAICRHAQVLAIMVNETATITASATMICKDAASAADLKKSIETGLLDFKNVLKEGKNEDGTFKEILLWKIIPKNAETFVNPVKVSTADNRVIATLSVDPAVFAPPPKAPGGPQINEDQKLPNPK